MDFIAENLTDNPSLDEIAAAAAFSKFHFHRLFQAHVGETVLEFTRRLRLENAAVHLHFDPAKDITSIALDCGFSSSQNFAKAFKKHFGMSPSQYRFIDAYKTRSFRRKNGNTESKDGNAPPSPIDQDHGLSNSNDHDNEDRIMTIEVIEVPAKNVAYVRTIGEYGLDGASRAFNKLAHWAGPRGLMEKGDALGIAWDNPCVTPPEKCRYDACITVDESIEINGGADHQVVPAGLYAVNRTHVYNNNFQQGWDDLIGEWLPDSGYQPADGPSYEIYVDMGTNDPEGRWLVDIHLPVKPL